MDKCLKGKVDKILRHQANVYIPTFMLILLFQAYCKHNIRLKLKKLKHNETHPEKHYDYKNVFKTLSASLMRTNILIWRYANEQIL